MTLESMMILQRRNERKRHYKKFCGENKIEKYPKKSLRIIQKNITSATVIIQKNQHYLIRQRNEKILLGGLWEFPTYRIENSSPIKTSLEKALFKELRQMIKVQKPIGTYKQTYTHLHETLHAFQCPTSILIKKPRGNNWKWTNFDKAKELAWPRVQKKIWKSLEEKMLQATGLKLQDTKKSTRRNAI